MPVTKPGQRTRKVVSIEKKKKQKKKKNALLLKKGKAVIAEQEKIDKQKKLIKNGRKY